MQYLITAYDATDEGALQRRSDARADHLENMKKVQETAMVVCAGAIRNDQEQPVGSYLIMDFADKAQLDAYLANEPYVTANVWGQVKAEPCTVVIQNNERVGK